MKLFGITKELIKITKSEEKVLSLEAVEVVLVQCNLVGNQNQETSEVLYSFMPNASHVKPTNKEFNVLENF